MRTIILTLALAGLGNLAFGDDAVPSGVPVPPSVRLPPCAESAPCPSAAPAFVPVLGGREAVQAELERLLTEASRLRRELGADIQVLVHVRVMEFSRTKLQKLGFEFQDAAGKTTSVVKALSRTGDRNNGQPGLLLPGNREVFSMDVISSGDPFFATVEALRKDRLVRVLAEPTLVATNRERASLSVGSNLPVPVPQGNGSTATDFKDYGTKVELVPNVLPDQRIRLDIQVRVADINAAHSVVIAGQTVPGLSIREFATAVELKSGQSAVMGGLVQKRVDQVTGKTQSWGASLFSWMRGVVAAAGPKQPSDTAGKGDRGAKVDGETNEEVELVAVLTAELVQPMAPQNATNSELRK